MDLASYFVANYFEMIYAISPPLDAVEVSTYRLALIVYDKELVLKKKEWAIICISSQWTVEIILVLPQLFS